jgi:hypothetical protein
VILVFALVLSAPALSAAPATPRPAAPIDPVAAILDAFRTHDVVALGDGAHGNEQAHAFRLALIRDVRFTATVNDIVVECGNALYQDEMDRFVRGDDVPYDALRQVWQNTTQNNQVWDRPIYEEFFRAVRAINASLPRERRLRVLLGGPPINWARIMSGKEAPDRWWRGAKQSYPVEVIRRDVLQKHRRALLIFANTYVFHGGQSLVGLLEAATSVKVFAVMTLVFAEDMAPLYARQSDVASWRAPSLAIVHRTKLDIRPYYFRDAVLYLGPSSAMTQSPLPLSLCNDDKYFEMRRRRMVMTGLYGVVDDIRNECAAVRRFTK